MNDYYNILKEYQELKANYESQKNDIDIIIRYFQTFQSNFIALFQSCHIKDFLKEDPHNFFTKTCKNFFEEIHHSYLNELDAPFQILKVLKLSQTETFSNSINLFNDIKDELIDEKKKLNKAKNELLEFLNQKKETKKNSNNYDDNLLFQAQKQNLLNLYQYELNRMNEMIDINNQKYNQIINELDIMKENNDLTYKKVILKFVNILGNLGKKLVEFNDNVSMKLENIIVQKKEIKARFPPEVNEFCQNKIPIKEEKDNNNLNEIKCLDDIIIQKKSEEQKKLKTLVKEKDIVIMIMNEFIKKLSDDKEISSNKISEFLENIQSDFLKYSKIFLTNLKKVYKNQIINCKNNNNFIHLSNIFNNIIIKKEDDIQIINEIIEISQKIKNKDMYMTSMIQKENKFLSTRTFWNKLIERKIIFLLNEYCKNEIQKK